MGKFLGRTLNTDTMCYEFSDKSGSSISLEIVETASDLIDLEDPIEQSYVIAGLFKHGSISSYVLSSDLTTDYEKVIRRKYE